MSLRPPSEELQRFKPKQELDLPPRLFRQLLNPYKQAAKLNQFSDEYADIHPKNCIGTFWDNDKKRVVKINLGYVNVNCNYLYRAAPSFADSSLSVNILSREEGAALCKSSGVLLALSAATAKSTPEDENGFHLKKSGYVCNTRTNVNGLAKRLKNRQKKC